MLLNDAAVRICDKINTRLEPLRVTRHKIEGATVIDAGVAVTGSLDAGILLSRICLGDAADIQIQSCDPALYVTDCAISVHTDCPLKACLGSQYAGWPLQTDDYFAMASGPMRMARGREEVLTELHLVETASHVSGVLESDKLPTSAAIASIAKDCKVESSQVTLCVAPVTSIAGTIQVVARSVETAMHKLHACGFDVSSVISGYGCAPIPPMAKPGDTVGGIGRTNDAILYGGRVTLWVDGDQAMIDEMGPRFPSCSSADHGRPFAAIFKDYDYDFYKVDPNLFCPAVITIVNLRTGITQRFGQIASDVLHQSFGF